MSLLRFGPKPTLLLLAWICVCVADLAVCSRSSQGADQVTDSQGIEYFEQHVRPLLIRHCYECHSGEEDNGGLRLDSRSATLAGGDSGPALRPGDPDSSLIIEAVRYHNREFQMPPQNRLSDTEISRLERWVALGAPDPRTETPSSTSTPPTGMTIEDGRQFWSFQPVPKPEVPSFPGNQWVKTPIDAFVLRELQSRNIKPAPPVDRLSWLRRVTFDLTGLPPTPREIDAFMADSSESAHSKVIDRLLASPDYGVRWGRHWLDVARYADSNGLDENLAYGNAWRYRDYVVASMNENKPYDRFLIEQIAGDLLPDATTETKIATGFLALGAKVLAEPDREKLVMDTIDEQLDTLGKAFMGLTLGCVRCHDHKFDPIKQSDYYALAAIFKSTQSFGDTNQGAIKHWYEHSFASDEELASIKEIETKIAAKKKLATNFKNAAITELRNEARERAADYLVAATQFSPAATLGEVTKIAKPLGLHPRILHHCRLHVHYAADDPFFSQWHDRADDPESVHQHFQALFENVEKSLLESRKEGSSTKTLSDPNLEAARKALYDNTGFLAVPPKPEFAFDAATLARYNELQEAARVLESHSPDSPSAMGVSDGEIHPRLPIHIRGSHLIHGDAVEREFPAVMRRSEVRPVWPSSQSGRLELARWLADTRHPLTARVFVNRVWRWHFGQGIVRTTENFGALGSRPSNPELLDYLAYRFMQSGWSVKDLHRLILSSSVYSLGDRATLEARVADPENQYFGRFTPQRLAAEQIRDSILASSGRLDRRFNGKTVPLRNRQFVFNHTSVDHTKYDSLRRAAYLPVIRNNVYTFFEQFDFPDPTMPTGSRNSTVVAPQALLMLNSDLVIDSAQHFAELLLENKTDNNQRIEYLYRRAFGRLPSDREIDRALAFLSGDGNAKSASEEFRVWALLCHSVLASNEFITVR